MTEHHLPQFAPRTVANARRSSNIGLLVFGTVAVLGSLLAIGWMSGVLQLGTPEDVGLGSAAAKMGRTSLQGDTWSYYHDRTYDTKNTGPRWREDRARSTDPNDAVLGNTTRWEYDGPYRYGPYGSDGMQRRAKGSEKVDPLYSNTLSPTSVFDEGRDLDPSGGNPVGVVPSNFTNPYYDPYAGYSNPYANRIRMSFGEGYGAGATGY